MRCRKMLHLSDDHIHQMREAGRAGRAAAIVHQHGFGRPAAFRNARLQRFHHACAQF